MGVGESFLVALNMLRMHKLRAFLTMLGVIIGVMSVTMIVMVSNGFKAYLDNEFKRLGSDTIFMFFDPGRRGRGQTSGGIDKITTEDIEFLKRKVPSLDIISGTVQVGGQRVKFGDLEFDNPTVYGTDEHFQTLNRFNIVKGRSLTADDVRNRANVCIAGEDIVARLFPGRDPVGQTVTLKGIALQIVGVIERSEFLGNNTARTLYVPRSTVQDKWVGGQKIDFVTMRPKAGVSPNDTMDRVWEAMMLRSNNKAIYRIDSNESIQNVFGGLVGAAGGILAAIAALSLLVGGVGIMNIMLVSVTERTREIGLRKAVGAKQGAILTQFLVEAGTLSLIGGCIGMGLAWSLGQLVQLATTARQWPNPNGLQTPFPVSAAIASAAFSALIGMVFGLFPALTASRLDPIVALRTE